ncbi:hypothetical protein COLO4_34119 [Corchorus olitorius]|uniref:Uncharacterized protein n=1 Tax=Corchorus olitorius TaxID=93759 RepID=A0A1R3GNK6_9ROSI|nr:hypothetical protein COLO4_34119 [Corchorus olitorius]
MASLQAKHCKPSTHPTVNHWMEVLTPKGPRSGDTGEGSSSVVEKPDLAISSGVYKEQITALRPGGREEHYGGGLESIGGLSELQRGVVSGGDDFRLGLGGCV